MFNPYFYTVPLFDFSERFPVLKGSGIFVAVDEHRFVVTAAHVVEASAEKRPQGGGHSQQDERASDRYRRDTRQQRRVVP
jgi:hypothetical protein